MNTEEVGLLTPRTRKAKQSKEPEIEGDLRAIEKPLEKNSMEVLKTAAEMEAELEAEQKEVKKPKRKRRVLEDHSF